MKIPSDDEIAQFFDNLTPEDFHTPNSTAQASEDELYPLHGGDEFERFTFKHLGELAASNEPKVVLHNGETARTYEPGGENLAEFLVRVAKEAPTFGAKWVFIGVPGEASMGAMFDPNNMADVNRARREGHMMDVLNWYAESIEPTSEEVRFGIIFNQDNEQKIVQSTFDNGANPAFRRVLRSQEG